MRKKSLVLAISLVLVLAIASVAVAAGNPIKLIANGNEVKSDVAPLMQDNRVLVPIRAAAEALGVQVVWDKENKAVVISKAGSGDKYLHGLNDPNAEKPSIHTNFIKNSDLLAILDDDKDNDLADYRDGHNGGDKIENDPLVVDLRLQSDYDAGHIPGAIFIAPAEEIAQAENIAALRKALDAHVKNGGKNEVVVYCYTAHTAGLAAGALGCEGFNVKNLRFGYSISWEGTKTADAPIYAPREDKDGNVVPYPETK